MLYTLNLYSAVCQFISIKLGGKNDMLSVFMFFFRSLTQDETSG